MWPPGMYVCLGVGRGGAVYVNSGEVNTACGLHGRSFVDKLGFLLTQLPVNGCSIWQFCRKLTANKPGCSKRLTLLLRMGFL